MAVIHEDGEREYVDGVELESASPVPPDPETAETSKTAEIQAGNEPDLFG